MKLLLIGGTGFVSGRVLHYALQYGHKVIAVTRGSKELPKHESLHHIRADRNLDDLTAIADDYEYDAVLDVIGQNEKHARQSIVLARKCKRLVMVSSDYAYDPAYRKLAMKESEARFSERDDYGGYKREAERVVLDAFAKGTVLPTILRPPHIYGPGSNPGTIPQHGRRPHLLRDIREGKTLSLLHGGLGLIQPIHVDDLARIILSIVDKPAAYGEDFTACGIELMSHLEYYQRLAECIGRDIKSVAYCPGPEVEDVNHYVPGHRYYDTSKLKAVLGDFSYTPFAQGMKEWVTELMATETAVD